MHKKGILVTVLIILTLSLTTVIFAGCSVRAQVEAKTKVKMGAADFIDKKVEIKKGEAITLVNAVPSTHYISNGTWDNGKAKPMSEPNAPTLSAVAVSGTGSITVGPFNQAGEFKYYCTIHPNMNLTVVVK
ncbi:copper binding plastocyanin/azurin family protein [Thermosporothrix hazakensis]|jgi:plastocyanin|uniref:Copper binding plastocyanin/azurin family protein n=2 Tax=Thermosporothrix TaxID=768650 RepID=A0A326UBV9_THEHA|nr:plastocyanin/azurin family copper-binding protein [Thermosporothrix hazakensis]PZW35987.1 copper binding plastocyanin/azurin family protein [Thermosporothrix hazakensis]BBH88455.1 hypothetical protein KTC_32060 [Thermosporothrix sp. COM3]GCE46641.1 hypothetical protein KTH_15100 [Thermosporothrix hazakensis]